MSRIRLERDNRERRGSTALGTATLSGHIRLLPDKRDNVSLSIPVICAIGAVAGMWTLVEVICFFPQSVALALALSFVFQAQGVSAEEAVAFRGKE